MARVKFTANLKRFYPDLNTLDVEGDSISEILDKINNKFPGIRDYILDEHGRLRQHVNIFIGENMIKDRNKLSDPVNTSDEVYIIQALSGGLTQVSIY